MTTSINYYRIASDCSSSYARDVNGSLPSYRADADGVRFACNTPVANIDVVIACGEVKTGAIAQRNIVAAACVVSERKSTDSCILIAGRVELKRPSARACVLVAGRAAPERKSTVGRVTVADCVAIKRLTAGGCVVGSSCVLVKRQSTSGRVIAAGGVAKKRGTTDGRVEEAGCKAVERIIPLSSVLTGIASGWCRKNRSSCWRKRKAGERERHENQGGTCNQAREHGCSRPVNLNLDWFFHKYYCFLFGLSLSGSCLPFAIHSRKCEMKFRKNF